MFNNALYMCIIAIQGNFRLGIDITEQILRKIDIVDRRPAKPGEKKR